MNTATFVAVCIIALSAVYAAPTHKECNAKEQCASKTAGSYPYKRDSTRFFTCDEHYNNLGCQQCGAPNTFYSKECDACLSRIDVQNKNCPKVETTPSDGQGQNPDNNCAPTGFCNGKQNATYQDPNDIERFFSCVDGVATLCQRCPASLVYSEACEKCLFSDIEDPADCPTDSVGSTPAIETCPASFCNGKKNGDYEQDDNSGMFYTCTEGSCIVNKCPAGTVFVSACNNRCEVTYTKNADECPASTETSTKAPKACPANFCDGKDDGNHAKNSHKESNEYYSCSNDICYVRNCSTGLVYKGSICNWPSAH
jgi:hypothetical protein